MPVRDTHEGAGEGEVNAVVFVKAVLSQRVPRVSTTDCVAVFTETGLEAAASLSEVGSIAVKAGDAVDAGGRRGRSSRRGVDQGAAERGGKGEDKFDVKKAEGFDQGEKLREKGDRKVGGFGDGGEGSGRVEVSGFGLGESPMNEGERIAKLEE